MEVTGCVGGAVGGCKSMSEASGILSRERSQVKDDPI